MGAPSPIYSFLAFLIVEALIAFGYVQRDQALTAEASLEQFLFYLWLAILALAGLHKVIDLHKHQVTKQAEVDKAQFVDGVVEEEKPTVAVKTEGDTQVFTTPTTPPNGGTPPTQPEQQLEPKSENL